jgi:hypothetical protein
MQAARAFHTATPLSDGRVLIAGGESLMGITATAEIYDPKTRIFTPTGPMMTPRLFHTATLLKTGKVLVVGGRTNGSAIAPTTELYDPTMGTWSSAGTPLRPRTDHVASILADGRVIVIGGTTGDGVSKSCEYYSPANNSWSEAPPLLDARDKVGAAILLSNGYVMVAGGRTLSTTVMDDTATSEGLPPNGTAWAHTNGSLAGKRHSHTATLLSGDRVLVTGGVQGNLVLDTAEIFSLGTMTLSPAGTMHSKRNGHAATVLMDGRVLITGGRLGTDGGDTLATTEIYDPAGNAWSEGPVLTGPRAFHTGTMWIAPDEAE